MDGTGLLDNARYLHVWILSHVGLSIYGSRAVVAGESSGEIRTNQLATRCAYVGAVFLA